MIAILRNFTENIKPVELFPGVILRKVNDSELEMVKALNEKEQIVDDRGVSPYVFDFTTDQQWFMRKTHLYGCIEIDDNYTKRLLYGLRVLEPKLDFALICNNNFRYISVLPGFSFYSPRQFQRLLYTARFLKLPEKTIFPKPEFNLDHLKSFSDDSFVMHSLIDYHHLQRLDENEPLYLFGLFSILNNLLIEDKRTRDIGKTLARKIELLVSQGNLIPPVFSKYGLKKMDLSEFLITLYHYRNDIAHGSKPKLKKGLEILEGRTDNIFYYLDELTRAVLRYCIAFPQASQALRV